MKIIFKILIIILMIHPNILNAQIDVRLKTKYELTLRRLEFAKDVEISFPNTNARSLLNEAGDLLNRSRNNYVAGRYLLANRQIERANNIISDALIIILDIPLRRQREKLNELIKSAEEAISNGGNIKADKFLRDAKDNQTKAINAYVKGKYQLAIEHFRLAFFFANKAIGIADNQSIDIQEKVSDEKKRLEQLLQKAKDAIDNSQNSTAVRLFRLAEKQIQKTKKAIKDNNYNQAIEYYHQATRLLLRAIDIAANKEDQPGITAHDDVIALDELIEGIQEKIEAANIQHNERISFLVDRILEFQQKAHDALEEKQYNVVQIDIQQAHTLIERTLQVLNKSESSQEANRIEDALDQLNINLEETSSLVNESGNEEALVLLDLAYAARGRAQTLLERGREQLTLGAIAIANKFAFAAERTIKEPDLNPKDENIVKKGLNQLALSIAKSKTKERRMSLIDKLFLNEAEKMYQVASNAMDRGFFIVADECVQIAQGYLNKISKWF